jgi:hypothetical protein
MKRSERALFGVCEQREAVGSPPPAASVKLCPHHEPGSPAAELVGGPTERDESEGEAAKKRAPTQRRSRDAQRQRGHHKRRQRVEGHGEGPGQGRLRPPQDHRGAPREGVKQPRGLPHRKSGADETSRKEVPLRQSRQSPASDPIRGCLTGPK